METTEQRNLARSGAQGLFVPRDEDRFAESRDLGISTLTFKVSTADSGGSLLAIEQVHHAKGGPARHLHPAQDEWFYVVEGEYLVEVDSDLFRLRPGDSAFGPRGVPHTWAFVGDGIGRIALVLTPAGRLESFFRELTRLGAMAPQAPAFWRAYDLELLGLPLDV